MGWVKEAPNWSLLGGVFKTITQNAAKAEDRGEKRKLCKESRIFDLEEIFTLQIYKR